MNEEQLYSKPNEPNYVSGLSDEQVAERVHRGLVNITENTGTKTVGQIILGNLITPFNILNVILAALILFVGSYKNLLFMGVILCNTLIGIIQEIKAKKTIDRLSLVTAPKARVIRNGVKNEIAVSELVLDDIMLLSTGNQICSDSTVVDGACEVDESLLTGESDPVAKKCGDSLLSGSFIVSGTCRAHIDHIGQDNYAAKVAADSKYIKKPNSEILLWTTRMIKFIGFSIIPIGLLLFYKQFFIMGSDFRQSVISTVAALIGMIPEGLVLLTSVVLAVSVIRLSRHKALVQELYSIETLAHVDTLCLDKTGTITEGTLQTDAVVPLNGTDRDTCEQALSALVHSLNDGSPTMNAILEFLPSSPEWPCEQQTPFSSARKWSAAAFREKGTYLLGAAEFILRDRVDSIRDQMEKFASKGHRILLLAHSSKKISGTELPGDVHPLALVLLSDKIRKNAEKTLGFFADQGVDIKVISGDNALTAACIAQKAGLKNSQSQIDVSTLKSEEELAQAAENYSVFGRVTPQQKLLLVKSLKAKNHTVAMTGDGVNDVPALKESDCSIAMASGSDAARTVSQIVLLNSDFASMPLILNEGRRSINNLQRSASLFLVKASFSAIIAVIFLFLSCDYPFQPIQFTLINAVTIGAPSLVLALEPNRERLKGKFIFNVLEKSLPGALAMAVNVIMLACISTFLGFSSKELSTLSVLLTGATGLMLLFKVCFPFRFSRAVLFILMCTVFLLALVFFAPLFEITPLTLPMLFILVPMLLFAASFMAAAFHLTDRVILRKH